MIEVMQCCNVAIKEVDRRKRVIRRKEYSKDTAISIRPTKEGIHMIIHIGNKAEIYFSSKFHGEVPYVFDIYALTLRHTGSFSYRRRR